jgi:hypothetical protein
LHNLLRLPIASCGGTGILTSFPSTTRFRLVLGADSPCADERCAGNLGLTARELFTPFIATHVSIRTSDTSSRPYDPPSQAYGTLSYQREHFIHPTHSSSTLSASPLQIATIDDSTLRDALVSVALFRALNFANDAKLASTKRGGRMGRMKCSRPAASVYSLSPVTSSAQDDSTSELLRFL